MRNATIVRRKATPKMTPMAMPTFSPVDMPWDADAVGSLVEVEEAAAAVALVGLVERLIEPLLVTVTTEGEDLALVVALLVLESSADVLAAEELVAAGVASTVEDVFCSSWLEEEELFVAFALELELVELESSLGAV